LREAIDSLPIESRLSRVFARNIRSFELMGTGTLRTPSPASWANLTLNNMAHDVREALPDDEDEE
jgi:hypothetical protein